MRQHVMTDPSITNLRRASNAVYLACEEAVAADISNLLLWAADEIERLSALPSTDSLCPDCGRAVDGPTHAAYCAVTRPVGNATGNTEDGAS